MRDELRLRLAAKVKRGFRPLVDVELLRRAITCALEPEGLAGDVEVSLVLTDDPSVRKLNAAYRGIDSTTDVLSFPMEGGEGTRFVSPSDAVKQLGDIVISVPKAQEQAVEYGHSFERELAYLTVHGLLHLLGYDHEEEMEREAMRAKEESALRGLVEK